MTLVSIVIPSRARPSELLRCLSSVAGLSFASREVVVVEQGDGLPITPDLLAARGIDVHVPSRTIGKCAALNEGIRAARGEVLAFTDDDCTVPPDWVSRALAWFETEPDAGIVCGQAKAALHDPEKTFVPQFGPRQPSVRRGRTATSHIGALGGNMLVHRKVFDTVGLFDEMLGPGAPYHSAEDQDFNNRALRAGFAVCYDPSIVVTHWGGRDYANGSAAALLRDYSVGIGALAAKSLRSGDYASCYAVVRELGAEARDAARRCCGRGAPGPFVLRSPSLVAGFVRGLRQPLDRSRGVFVSQRR